MNEFCTARTAAKDQAVGCINQREMFSSKIKFCGQILFKPQEPVNDFLRCCSKIAASAALKF